MGNIIFDFEPFRYETAKNKSNKKTEVGTLFLQIIARAVEYNIYKYVPF